MISFVHAQLRGGRKSARVVFTLWSKSQNYTKRVANSFQGPSSIGRSTRWTVHDSFFSFFMSVVFLHFDLRMALRWASSARSTCCGSMQPASPSVSLLCCVHVVCVCVCPHKQLEERLMMLMLNLQDISGLESCRSLRSQ